MIQGMDSDKDGALSESEWNKAMGAFCQHGFTGLDGGPRRVPDQKTRNVSRGNTGVAFPRFLRRSPAEEKCSWCATAASCNASIPPKATVLYQERLGVLGGYAASPVSAQDHIYLASQSGTVIVVDAGSDSLKILARKHARGKNFRHPSLGGKRHLRAHGAPSVRIHR